ncbi:hypothetical protein ASPVEDRAFT_89432 [Aspergillus versicolor CBS 583.65]|uniref:Uncharacterized protein n=1 Tax=Aspergillus versicolor CBS 583.65 TaxID=1036611 RepID=A0A1L9Q355_ASPVE|nr:uncharacterized protein ASPVEDRAFT_89432 [Aspergillus versicolor CBS 583.65]OJJ08203.1 hypothetical protein ASPVEDRAFT_89432 [Aspergillus versicolor CBS 583.65]
MLGLNLRLELEEEEITVVVGAYSPREGEKLVKLVQDLGRYGRFTKPIGRPGFVFYDGMTEFKRECHRIGEATWDTNTEASELLNICAFQGRLANVGFLKPRELMIWWMRDTLERLATSYAWSTLVIAMVLDPEPPAESDQVFQTNELYDGPVLGLERWNFWQRRFAEISISEQYPVNDEARRIAGDAAGYMAALARTGSAHAW